MSTSELASPITAHRHERRRERGHGDDEQQRCRPQQHADAEVGGDATAGRRASSATKPPTTLPIPSTAPSKPTPDSPSSSRSIAMLTSKTREAPATTVCAVISAVTRRRSGAGGDGAEPGAGLTEDAERLGGRLGRVGGVAAVGRALVRCHRHAEPREQGDGHHERAGVDEVDDRDVGDRQQHPGDGRPGEEAEAVDRRRHDVGARQLAWVARQLREQGGLGGPERQRQDGREEAGAVDRGDRAVGGDRRPRRPPRRPPSRRRNRS